MQRRALLRWSLQLCAQGQEACPVHSQVLSTARFSDQPASHRATDGTLPASPGTPVSSSSQTVSTSSRLNVLNSNAAIPASAALRAGPATFPGNVPPQVAAAAAAASAASPAPQSPIEWLAARQKALDAVPIIPRLLGFAGAIPFLLLTPYSMEAVGLTSMLQDAARAQVNYGAIIVTFLGAVHWGMAMTSTAAGSWATSMLRERYVWSVFPSLAVWPVLMMETAPASLAVALMLGLCYLSDRNYAHLGFIPAWYHTLRGWLTLLSMLAMLSTTAYCVSKDVEKAQARIAEEEKQRLARRNSSPVTPMPGLASKAA